MAGVNLNVAHVIRGLDSNGDAVSGAKLYVYEAGTTTPVTTYADIDLNTANAHPVVADSAGAWGPVYLARGTYKIDVTNSVGTSLPGYPEDDVGVGPLMDLADDTSPQLGGDLDVNGFKIVSTANGDIVLEPDGSGNIQLLAADVLVEEDIVHVGDLDNKITFGTDTQDYQTGGSSRLDISDSGVRLGGANARVTTILDEDDMASDSDTALATQQSIKAYVDATANPFGSSLLHITHSLASTNNGGGFTSGSWQTRPINTVVTNEISGASLLSNVITLPAGTYFAMGWSKVGRVDAHMARLRNTDDSTTEVLGRPGTIQRGDVDDYGGEAEASLVGRFTLAAEKALELQHLCETTKATSGFGADNGLGETNTFADLLIWKVA